MSEEEHKVSWLGLISTWAAAGGAKAGEVITDVKHIVCGLTISEWASAAALVYTLMQAILIMPKVIRTIKGWIHGKPQDGG